MRMLNNEKRTNNSDGNVIFFILLAVALFAGLTYAVTSSDQGQSETTLFEKGKSSVTSSDNNLCTSKINSGIEYLKSVNGCSQDQISYELADGTNENTDAPSDERCHLFKRKGAGLEACGSYTDPLIVIGQITGGDTSTVAMFPSGTYMKCNSWNGANTICENLQLSMDGASYVNIENICMKKTGDGRATITFPDNFVTSACNVACAGGVTEWYTGTLSGTYYLEDDYTFTSHGGGCAGGSVNVGNVECDCF